MATLKNVKINGNVQYSNPDGSWHHNGGVHANTTPNANPDRPVPSDNNMSWLEAGPDGTDQNVAVIDVKNMQEVADLITLKGKCTMRHSVNLASNAPEVTMTLLVRKTGGNQNKGEAQVTYSDEPSGESKFLPFYSYVEIITS